MVAQKGADVVVSIKIELETAKKQLKKAKEAINDATKVTQGRAKDLIKAENNVKSLAKSYKEAAAAAAEAASRKPFSQKALKNLAPIANLATSAVAHLDTTFDSLDQTMLNQQKVSKQTFDIFKKATAKVVSIDKPLKKVKKGFDSASLGILFFGMALKRVFDTISKSSIATFREVVSSTEGATSNFDKLEGSLKFLQFTIGQALEPFVLLLLPIIDKLQVWIEENDTLAAGLLIFIGVLGSLLFFFATLKLGLSALGTSLPELGTALGGLGTKIAAFFGVSLLTVVAVAIAAVVLLVAAWKTNLGNIKGFVDTVWKDLKALFTQGVDAIKDIFEGLFKIIKGLFTGDFDLIWEGIVQTVLGAAKLIVSIMLNLGAVIVNIFLFAGNIASDMFFNLLKIAIGAVKKVVGLINKVTGLEIKTSGLDSIIDKLEQSKLDARVDYVSGANLSQNIIDKIDKAQDINVTVENKIELDGEQIAQNTSERVLNQVQSQGA